MKSFITQLYSMECISQAFLRLTNKLCSCRLVITIDKSPNNYNALFIKVIPLNMEWLH